MAERTGVQSVLVHDADIIAARQLLWDRYRLAVEHGGATAFAALFTGAHQPSDGERIAVVLCGANTDPATPGLSAPAPAETRPSLTRKAACHAGQPWWRCSAAGPGADVGSALRDGEDEPFVTQDSHRAADCVPADVMFLGERGLGRERVQPGQFA